MWKRIKISKNKNGKPQNQGTLGTAAFCAIINPSINIKGRFRT